MKSYYKFINENKYQKFEKGDLVIPNDQLKDDIENYHWPSEMFKLIGQTGVIISFYDKKNAYGVDFNGEYWLMYGNTLDPAEPKKIRWYKKGKLLNEKLNESVEEPIFNIGDKVMITSDLLYDINEHEWSIEMKELINKEFTIKDIQHRGSFTEYYFEETDYYVYGDCLSLINSEPPKIRWYKKGKFNNEKTNESIYRPLFNKGDRVIINEHILEDLFKYEKYKDARKNLIGKEGIIDRYFFYNKIYYYEVTIDNFTWDIIEKCLDPISSKIKWYKRGNFIEEEKTNEFFRGHRMTNALWRDIQVRKLRMKFNDILELFFIDDIKESGKKKIEVLKNKLLNRRVAFYYEFDRGIDGIEIRQEIMIVNKVDYQGFDLLTFKKNILLEGTPEIGRMTSIYIDTKYPIAVISKVNRNFSENDPYGEENWE